MPIDQSEAIVLRTYNLGDQDKLVVFFTRENGILRGVAMGARKFGNRFGSSLEPMSVVRIFYYEKERKDLITINNCDLLGSFFEAQNDLKVSCTVSYFAELIEEFSPSRSKDDVLFRLLLSVLRCFAAKGNPAFLARYFEGWFLKINGLLPDLGRCKKCRKPLSGPAWLSPKRDGAYCGECAPARKEAVPPETASFLKWIRDNPPSEACPLSFDRSKLAAMSGVLQAMITFHLEREPRTLRYLKSET